MKITEAIKFLSPAIEKKNKIQPVLEHVRITQNYAIAYNGMLALAAPVALPLTCTPNGIMLEEAVKRFGDNFTAVQKPNGDLYFEGNKFKVTIPCTTDDFPMPDFSGTPVMSGKGFVDKIKKLLPFTDDNNNLAPWMGSILLRDGRAYATCGHTLAFCPVDIPEGSDLALPVEAAEAMVQIGEEPEYIARGEHRLSVVYSGGRFLSSPLVHTPWPAVKQIGHPAAQCGVLPGLFEAIKSIEPFGISNDRQNFYIGNGYVSSARDGQGARMEVEGLVGNWSWNHLSVRLIEKHCKHLQINAKTSSWSGDGIEGRLRIGDLN
jgi:hypothetical protein